jgi:hypothetical protein
MKATTGRVKAHALVKDKDGKPKIDNIKGIPPQIWEMLTEQEQKEVIKNGGYALSSD